MSLPNAALCTGCGVCQYACKKGAIELKSDSVGFLHPEIDSKLCSGCGLCEKLCPIVSKAKTESIKKIYALRAKDIKLEASSSSGGAFSVLAKSIFAKGGVVYGAGFDKDFNVCHKRADSEAQLELLRGSKYVQSYFYDAAVSALEDLKDGKEVLFSGTPCQIAAIKNMASAYSDNLYLVDFVCHGVPSPELFAKYRDFIKGQRQITSISFRDKTEGWHNYSFKASFDDGSCYRKVINQDPYLLAFVQNVSLRNSCFNCSFLGTERASDITLGDAWTQTVQTEELADGRGVSLVLVNSHKGQLLMDSAKGGYISEELDVSEAEKIRPLNSATPYNPVRDMYLKDMNKLSFDKLTNKYCSASATAKIRRFLVKKAYKWRK